MRLILANVAFFQRVHLQLAAQHFSCFCKVRRQIIGMGNVLKCELQQLFFGITNDFAELSIDAKPPTFGAHVSNADSGQLERGAVHLLTLAEGMLESGTALEDLLDIDWTCKFSDRRVEEALVAAHFIESVG